MFVLCGVAAACPSTDTKRQKEWPRATEPRLSVSAAPRANSDCEDTQNAHEAAMLLPDPHCTTAAIETLSLHANEPHALSDLAAAYYLRARRDHDPADFLRALDAGEDAVRHDPNDRDARFNLALTQEALYLRDDALASWKALGNDAEARAQYERMAKESDGTTRWRASHPQLLEALRTKDKAAIARLIRPFPSSAEAFVEEELLPDRVEDARLVAELWSKQTGDRFLVDVVHAFDTTSDRNALREGHRKYAAARKAQRELAPAAALYAQADTLLARGGSPLRLLTEMRSVEMPQLATLIEEARAHRYLSVAGRMLWFRANLLMGQSRYPESLRDYEAAVDIFRHTGDAENLVNVLGRKGSVYVHAGEHERAWRDAFDAGRYANLVVELPARHNLYGELADAARDLDHVAAAMRYQNAAIAILERELLRVPPERDDLRNAINGNFAIAYRKRAELEIRRGRIVAAAGDLGEAERLTTRTQDENAKKLLQARVEEIRGQLALRTNPRDAAAAFTRAIELSDPKDFPTYRASLFAQRADAFREAGDAVHAEADLREALSTVRGEQSMILGSRARGQSEELWTAYFSRFQDTFERLIDQLMRERRYAAAFDYAEAARASEPLDLVRHLPNAPPQINTVAGTIPVTRLQRLLPPNTFLLQYAVQENHTYTWILSHDLGVVMRQRVRRRDIERWADALQRAAHGRNSAAFDAALIAPHEELLAQPLEAIARMGGKQPRLIIVPDGAMRGLPFAGFQNPDTKRYLFEEATLEFAPSATLYAFSLWQDARLPHNDDHLLLVGNPAFDTNNPIAAGLAPLPGAAREVQRIAEIYGDRAVTLIGAEATANNFLSRAADSAVVELAGHTVVDARTPARSALILARSDHDDGILDAEELLTQLRLDRTRLFILSTCSGAGGRPVGPEGVAPLVRPLIAAGVPAVVGSLWDVEDPTAEALLVSFHQHYAAGHDAAESLQLAQSELLHSGKPGLAPAIAWASFQVIGHASSPFASAHNVKKEKEKPP